ncbi:DUF547 domain-containing protein [Hymenobacter sp. B81]|uniref:DUF547 domain-containing protein n=1 Tax=Hymenobacter sp. B81 TaxID=3344878 RepID=UPI0037DDD2B7
MAWLVSAGLSGCNYVEYFIPLNPTSATGRPVNHAPWDALLKKHVDERGMVNYCGLQRDSAQLNGYLDSLGHNLPATHWSEAEQLAYWLNAYNAFTIRRVIRAYPIGSIRELGGEQTLLNTVWDQPFIALGNARYTLNDLEHRLIRRRFAEPRIHFALVCAAVSCPQLRREAYQATRLNAQLDDQARDFVNDPRKNQLTPPASPRVSAIFRFYPQDFHQGDATVQSWINRYARQPIASAAQLRYLPYNWQLNAQPETAGSPRE